MINKRPPPSALHLLVMKEVTEQERQRAIRRVRWRVLNHTFRDLSVEELCEWDDLSREFSHLTP